jgi:hypothetical protein
MSPEPKRRRSDARTPRKKLVLKKDTLKDLGPGRSGEAAIKGGASWTAPTASGRTTYNAGSAQFGGG